MKPVQAVPYLETEAFPVVPFILEGISARFIRENRIIPIEYKNNTLTVVLADPQDRRILDALRVAVSPHINLYASDTKAIDEYIAKFYGQETQDIGSLIEDMDRTAMQYVQEDEEDVGHLKDLASEAPIIRIVNLLISRAVESRASDIHVEPFEDEMKVRYRIDGVLHDIESIPKKLQAATISRIKIMAKLNIAERRLPQDGRIKIKLGIKEIDIRVSCIPVLYGESVVMRLLDRAGIVIDLARLGFHHQTLSGFNDLIQKPHGIFLVTGPTGSGKTTTLYGALDKINSPERKIITVEDPIEYQLKGINQIQVKPQIGLDFPTILRHIVRQDPDIIMIGEIRDLETAEIAIQSALTGHLVFSTLHTNDAASAITRLIDLGVESFLLSSTIRGILAQRLVRVICPSCKEQEPVAATIGRTFKSGEKDFINGASKENFHTVTESPAYWKGAGCPECAHSGFLGRIGIFELLIVDQDVRHLILKDVDAVRIKEAARQNGMKTLMEDGMMKVSEGVTTMSEVLRVTQEV